MYAYLHIPVSNCQVDLTSMFDHHNGGLSRILQRLNRREVAQSHLIYATCCYFVSMH